MPRFAALERFEILAAVLGGLWIGSLFLPWFDTAGDTVSGWGLIDSSWLGIVVVGVASLLLLLDAVSIDGFGALPVPAVASFLLPMGLFYTALFVLAGEGIAYGAWTALGLSAAALLFAVVAWTIDRRG
jgi:hypothetical protein